MTFAALLAGCDLTVTVGSECLLVTEVVTSPTPWVYRPEDCRFEHVPDIAVDTGDFQLDWVEICNASDQAIDARHYRLRTHPGDNPYGPPPLRLPDVELLGSECVVLVAEPDLETVCPVARDFDLDQELGANLELLGPEGSCHQDVHFSRLEPRESWVLGPAGWSVSSTPVPGDAELP